MEQFKSTTQQAFVEGYAAAIADRNKDVEVLIEALEWIMPRVHQASHEGELIECPKATCIEYRKALASYRGKE